MTEKVIENPVETTEIDVDPLITTKVAYVERIKSELSGIKEQMGILQYELDIRITALALYENALQMQDDPKENGKDKTPMEEANEMVEKAEKQMSQTVDNLDVKLKAHEDVCAVRYENIEKRLEAGSKRFDKIDKMILGLYTMLLGLTAYLEFVR